jgi:cardiolipin synthase
VIFQVDRDRVALLRDGAQAFPAMEAAIDAARHEILLEMYWVGNDDVGHRFLERLCAAARRGCRVCVIYDAVGSLTLRHRFWGPLLSVGGEVIDYHSLSPLRPGFRWRRLEERDHRKLLVVDGRVGVTGGINLARPWLAREVGGDGFRDDMILVDGPVTQELRTLFYRTWRKVGGHTPEDVAPLPRRPHGRVWVLSSLQRRRSLRKEYLQRLRRARKSIDIANPYFVPDRAVRQALEQATARGVRVRLLVPERGDVTIVQFALEGLFERLLRQGVEVYAWEGPVMHAKTAIVDETFVTVGSYNLDHRSLQKNLELNIAVEDRPFAQHARSRFEQDLANSRRVWLSEWRERALMRRPFEWVGLALRRFL